VKARQRTGVYPPTEVVDPGTILHEMRLRKTVPELESMRTAVARGLAAVCVLFVSLALTRVAFSAARDAGRIVGAATSADAKRLANMEISS